MMILILERGFQMKVLLIQPPTHGDLGLQAFILTEPLALEAVAASLLGEHEVQILDARLEPDIVGRLSSFRPEAVGVSVSFTPDVYNAHRVLETVRGMIPHIHTFVGGHHATMCHGDFAGLSDAVVLGEGEPTTPDLLRCWERGEALDGVAGIAFQGEEGWKQTPSRPLIENLDEIPIPARHLAAKYWGRYFHGKRRPCAHVETSRGCPYRCSFCSVWRFHQGKCRMRSPERVVREIQEIEAPNVFFCDDNFLANPDRARRICQALGEARVNKRYIMQIRADSVVRSPDVLEQWAEAGLESVFIGFEAVTQKRLDALEKRSSVRDNDEAISILRKLKISPMASLIIDPDFDRGDFAYLRGYLRQSKLPLPIIFSVLTPLPGTVLHQERGKELTTSDYRLFDLQHAVLPTRLGLKGFYQEYYKLYLSTYLSRFLPFGFVRRFSEGSPGSFFRQVRTGLRLFRGFSPGALLKAHSAT